MPAQITEIGYGGELISGSQLDADRYSQESPTEYDPGSAQAYGGDDGENSVDIDYEPSSTQKDPTMRSDLNRLAREGWEDLSKPRQDEPCGLTIAEWEAHKAQMQADQAHQQQQKMMHLAAAAAAGFIACRLLK